MACGFCDYTKEITNTREKIVVYVLDNTQSTTKNTLLTKTYFPFHILFEQLFTKNEEI